MEKTIGEDEIKSLEEEIDLAVDRLFVEKTRELAESPSMESQSVRATYEMGKSVVEEPLHAPSEPLPFLKPLDKVETQLLSVEWEITKEGLEKTRREIINFRSTLKEKPDIVSVLNLMEKVLNHMLKNETNIHPLLIKFLLDSKETIKLLMKKETIPEIKIYKRLAFEGIEARFSYLEKPKDTQVQPLSASSSEEVTKPEIPVEEWNKIEEMLNKMNLFSEKMEPILKKIEQQLSTLEQLTGKSQEPIIETRHPPVDITIFKIDEKLFGVKSDNILRLFKIPNTFYDKYSHQQTIRLKDFDVRMIDLKKILSIQGGAPKKEIKLILLKDNGGYKGLIVEQVLKRLSTQSEFESGAGEYFLGTIQWRYHEHPLEIPILDIKKL
jgi:chemotaxis protein histidine kinase CheA